MTLRSLILAGGVLLASVSPLAAQQVQQTTQERLFVPALSNWTTVQADHQGNTEITELVPQGQSQKDWHEMLTVELITGQVNGTPEDIVKAQSEQIKKSCESVGGGQIISGAQNGYETSMRAVGCSKSKQYGTGEMSLLKVIRGKDRLYVIIRVWRGEPFELDHMPLNEATTKDWFAFMQNVMVCVPMDRAHPCPDKVVK